MSSFAELVEHADHKPHVRHYHTAGSRSVVVADLHYAKRTSVTYNVEEMVLAIGVKTAPLKLSISGAAREPYAYSRGEFDLTPANCCYSSERLGGGSTIAISLPRDLVRETLSEFAPDFDGDFRALHDRPHSSDLVLPICQRLLVELEGDSPMGPLYADTLVQSLILELFRLSTETRAEAKPATQELAETKLRMIDEYIDENAMATVELRDLARLVGMPIAKFSRAFKETAGHTPYQYVLRRRLGKAQDMIRCTSEPLAEIAYQCGFASQSHMTDVFRSKLGTTPGQMRRH